VRDGYTQALKETVHQRVKLALGLKNQGERAITEDGYRVASVLHDCRNLLTRKNGHSHTSYGGRIQERSI
jgi:hypothetical protein